MAKNDPRPDWRVRSAVAMFKVMGALHVMPSDIGALPLAKRKSMRPPRFLTRPIPTGLRIVDREIPGRDGPVPVRIYRSGQASGPQPLVIYLHGGGWVVAGPDDSQYLTAQLAAHAGVTVISVDYRLAPDDPYPAALHDAYDACLWAAEEGAEIGGDPTRIAVMGDSAGGNLAAALCLLARRESKPHIAFQALLYPAVDATLSSPSMKSYVGPGLTREACDAVLTHYVAGADRSDPLISPLLAEDLAGLPPAHIVTADLDILREEGWLYAERLAEAGVPVRYTNYLGTMHGFFSLPRLARIEPQAVAELIQELRRALDLH